jgi:hypothetical protein
VVAFLSVSKHGVGFFSSLLENGLWNFEHGYRERLALLGALGALAVHLLSHPD